MRSLDNITVVVVAFEGLSKLFEQPKIIENRISKNSALRKSNFQFNSTDNMKSNSAMEEDKERFSKLTFDMQEENQFQDEISTASRTESTRKRSESSTALKNRLKDESRNESLPPNDGQLYQK